jgi:hypothetical protein
MSDLVELLMRPVMPEEYDRGEAPVMPYARAFGAGLVDPMGLPSWAYNKLAGSQNADWYMRRMQEARNESPFAAGVGSTVLPALLGLGGLRTLGQLTSAEAMGAFPEVMTLGAGVSGVRSAFVDPARKQRPQGSYPPGGAY